VKSRLFAISLYLTERYPRLREQRRLAWTFCQLSSVAWERVGAADSPPERPCALMITRQSPPGPTLNYCHWQYLVAPGAVCSGCLNQTHTCCPMILKHGSRGVSRYRLMTTHVQLHWTSPFSVLAIPSLERVCY
jgi:hypothetical protein